MECGADMTINSKNAKTARSSHGIAPLTASTPASSSNLFRDDPIRFLRVVEEFLDSTAPLVFDEQRWRELLINGVSENQITGSPATRQAVLGAMGADERSAT